MKVRKIKEIDKYKKEKIESALILPNANDYITSGGVNTLHFAGKIIVDGEEVSLSQLNDGIHIGNIETIRAGLEGDIASNGDDNYIVGSDELNIFLESTPSQQSIAEIMQYNPIAGNIRKAKVTKIDELYSLMYDVNFLQSTPKDKLYTIGLDVEANEIPYETIDGNIYIEPIPFFRLRAAESICEVVNAFAMVRGIPMPMRKILTSSTACIFQYPEYLLGGYSNHIDAIEGIRIESSVGLDGVKIYSTATFSGRDSLTDTEQLSTLHAIDISEVTSNRSEENE